MNLSMEIWLTQRIVLTMFLLGCPFLGYGQDGVSTAGSARTKYLSGLGLIPAPDEVVVEDFINYHRHELGRPKAGRAVGIDVRFGSAKVSLSGEAILQVGLSTALAHDRHQLRPVNLTLVIDKSGSMAADDKISRVKSALQTLVSQLRPSDRMAIVVFDSEASILSKSQRLTSRDRLLALIRSIEPGSSTNINGGLMLGLKEAERVFDPKATNRVILLTDGIANVGVTESAEISRGAAKFLEKGIDVSTIGVGRELNKDLLRELAEDGRGLYHFIADGQDIEKVFVNELQSLISPAAIKPQLEIAYGDEFELSNVFGYKPVIQRQRISIPLKTLNLGATQVVLVRFRLKPGHKGTESLSARAKLTFIDPSTNKTSAISDDSIIQVGHNNAKSATEDLSVAKNYAIAQLAQSLFEMSVHCKNGSYVSAEEVVSRAMRTTAKTFPNLEDDDVKRNLAIAQKYQAILYKEIESRGLKHQSAEHHESAEPSTNLISNGDFSMGNIGFISDLPYIKASPNCLWGMFYTVSPAFDQPDLLHTNIARNAFSAPEGGQVMFMNAGTFDPFTMWSSTVVCKPKTRYRISFYEIGLSGGPQWTNSYEIRVGNSRSEPQVGGDGKYVKISYEWYSDNASSATVAIRRLQHAHRGGITGICNIKMVPVKPVEVP